jgi:hypothetical protein
MVAECLQLSNVPGWSTGGTIHVIINNQVRAGRPAPALPPLQRCGSPCCITSGSPWRSTRPRPHVH